MRAVLDSILLSLVCIIIRIFWQSQSDQHTEVERAFLIHFQKWFLNKVFIRIKIAKDFKFYAYMVTSGSKSVKKCQKMLKKATIWTYIWFFRIFLPWLIWNISIAILCKKNMWCHYISFGVIFSHLVI